MNVEFLEHKPILHLEPYIQTFWHGDFNKSSIQEFTQSVLPNGCVELIIHLSADHCLLTKPDQYSSFTSPEITILGTYNKPYSVEFNQNVKVFGIRFFPDGIRNLFGVLPSEFMATYEDASYILGKELNDFGARMRDLHSEEDRVAYANNFFLKQLSRNKRSFDYTHMAMDLIRRRFGIVEYSEILSIVPISPRQLQREFKTQYGFTVMDYIRLMRLNAIQHYMLSNQMDLTRLSHELHFSDQSHFIREFKTYVGMPPKRFTKNLEQFIMNPLAMDT